MSTQLLLEAFTDGIATAVTKRNIATVVLIIAPMITLFFSISISDGSYFNTPSVLPLHIFLLFFLSFLLG